VVRARGTACLLALSLLSCSASWDERECTEDELGLIDHGVERATSVSGGVTEALEHRWGIDGPSLDAIATELLDAHDEGRIRCGTPPRDLAEAHGFVAGLSEKTAGVIYVNPEHDDWERAQLRWEASRDVAELTDAEILNEFGQGSTSLFELMAEVRELHFASTFPAEVLSHEAAHLAFPEWHHEYALDDPTRIVTPDFFVDVGDFTSRAIYNELWLPEAARLNELYRDACDPGSEWVPPCTR